MLAWSEGTDNGRQKTRNWRLYATGGELFTDYSDHPRKLVTLNPKLNQQAPDATSSFPLVDAYRNSLAWKTSLRKVRTLWHCSRLRSVALYLWLIVVIIRQSTVAAISGLHCWALVILPEHKADSLIAKFKEAGECGQRDWCGEQSHCDYLRSGLSASSSACHGLLIITVITRHYLQSPARQKCQRTEAGERGNYWHADASAWCCCARCTRRS